MSKISISSTNLSHGRYKSKNPTSDFDEVLPAEGRKQKVMHHQAFSHGKGFSTPHIQSHYSGWGRKVIQVCIKSRSTAETESTVGDRGEMDNGKQESRPYATFKSICPIFSIFLHSSLVYYQHHHHNFMAFESFPANWGVLNNFVNFLTRFWAAHTFLLLLPT